MGWDVVERKIGRAGGEKQRGARQRDWNLSGLLVQRTTLPSCRQSNMPILRSAG